LEKRYEEAFGYRVAGRSDGDRGLLAFDDPEPADVIRIRRRRLQQLRLEAVSLLKETDRAATTVAVRSSFFAAAVLVKG